ncbi:Sodium/calcium exchanger protein [Glomus cerebriforme]|uniref:Vacuolar calcium ion transporter n=1 Tax=Glomus cerebriforme TaxID=658196 RepID=A0A397T4E0_9GLOM|nr:Sodium/calcium exchanger protein [Glomus cerebriforme]
MTLSERNSQSNHTDLLSNEEINKPPTPTTQTVIHTSLRLNTPRLHWNDIVISILNFLAIIPLAKLIEFATEDNISLRVGQTIGGLLNITFGNAVELITSISFLKDGQIRIVQASILGSIISNLLLILGISFVAGGFYYKVQRFNQTAAQASSSLMALACIGLVIPAAFVSSINTINVISAEQRKGELLNLSHGTAVVLLIIYILYLLFQLKTHTYLYKEEREEEEEPQLTIFISLVLLAVVTVAVTFSADYLVGSIEGIVQSFGLSKTFVGFILFPIVNKSAEILNTIAAMGHNIDDTIKSATGCSLQIALFVSPLLVIIGWIIEREFTLFFQIFETIILLIIIMMTNYLVQDGESNWLKGSTEDTYIEFFFFLRAW